MPAAVIDIVLEPFGKGRNRLVERALRGTADACRRASDHGHERTLRMVAALGLRDNDRLPEPS
jgi:hypothetical protein